MKKLACILLVVCISLSSFARSSKKRSSATLNNDQIAKSQKSEKRELKSFNSKKYTAVTTGRRFHGKKNGNAPGGKGL